MPETLTNNTKLQSFHSNTETATKNNEYNFIRKPLSLVSSKWVHQKTVSILLKSANDKCNQNSDHQLFCITEKINQKKVLGASAKSPD